jgi:hypothetical protein
MKSRRFIFLPSSGAGQHYRELDVSIGSIASISVVRVMSAIIPIAARRPGLRLQLIDPNINPDRNAADAPAFGSG